MQIHQELELKSLRRGWYLASRLGGQKPTGDSLQFSGALQLYCAVSWQKHLHQGTLWEHTVYSVLSASFARSSPFSVGKAPTRFEVDAGVMFSCFRVVTCIFCQAEKESWIRTTSAVTAPSTRQHKSFKIRFLVFSWDALGVQKGGFSLPKSGCVARGESCQGSHRTRSRRPSP